MSCSNHKEKFKYNCQYCVQTLYQEYRKVFKKDLYLINQNNNGNKILTFGGRDLKKLNGCREFNMLTNEWFHFSNSDITLGNSTFGAIRAGNSIFCIGTFENHTYLQEFNLFLRSWTVKHQLFEDERTLCSLTYEPFSKSIYLIGGYSKDQKPLKSIHRFDLLTHVLSFVGDIIEPKFSAFSFFQKNNLYIIGGKTSNGNDTTVEVFNLKAKHTIAVYNLSSEIIRASTWDGLYTVYFFTNSSLHSIDIRDLKTRVTLDDKTWSMVGDGYSMVLNVEKTRLYIFGAKSFYYDLKSNTKVKIENRNSNIYFQSSICL